MSIDNSQGSSTSVGKKGSSNYPFFLYATDGSLIYFPKKSETKGCESIEIS